MKLSDAKRQRGYEALQTGLMNGTIWFEKESVGFVGQARNPPGENRPLNEIVQLGMVNDSLFSYLAENPTPECW